MSPRTATRRLLGVRPRPAALLDGVVGAAAFVATLALLRHGAGPPALHPARDLDPLGVLLAACSTGPLIAWRRFPVAVFVATSATSVLAVGLGYRYPADLLVGPTVALYLLAVGRGRPTRTSARTAATRQGVVVGLLAAYLVATGTLRGDLPWAEALHMIPIWAVAWFAGERTRLRREQVRQLGEDVRRAEREVERERLLAVAEERTRIARDLHDSAAHAISLIGVRAGAARLRHHEDPDRSLAALRAIEDLARQTVADIDRLVGTLRDEARSPHDVVAPPGLASLDTLVARHTEAGLRVTVDTSGPARRLGRAVDQAAYRIVQEALTNAANHGAGGARVNVSYGDAAVQVTVTNPTRPRSASRPNGGHGLVGMRERATMLGGRLDIDGANGTFRIRAHIPYEGRRP